MSLENSIKNMIQNFYKKLRLKIAVEACFSFISYETSQGRTQVKFTFFKK